MEFSELRLFGLALEEDSGHCDSNHNNDQLNIVKAVSQHIKGFIRSCPYQEQIDSMRQDEDRRLQVTGAEPNRINVRQLFIIVQVGEGIDG